MVQLQLVSTERTQASFSEPIPRKGTETIEVKRTWVRTKKLFFRTYSPQGDGNKLIALLLDSGSSG